jgi:hypothetical protein
MSQDASILFNDFDQRVKLCSPRHLMNIANFNAPTPEIARFSAICAIGRSLRANLSNLFEATNQKTKPDWCGIIDMVNTLADQIMPTSGAPLAAAEQVAWMKSTLLGFAQTWRSTNAQLSGVIVDLVNQITPFEPEELTAHLQELFEGGMDLATTCIREWGGKRSYELISRAQTVTLVFLENGNGPTYASCERLNDGECTVYLMIGNSSNLVKSYLSLEFYFFHEYLSHVLPEWDDLSGKLSEGYLFALQKAFFRASCHRLRNGFFLHSRIVDEDMNAHRQQAARSASLFSDIEGLYVWLDSNCKDGCLPRLLLDICTAGSTDRLHEKLLAIIELVANRQSTDLVQILCKAAEDPQSAYEQLRDRLGYPLAPSRAIKPGQLGSAIVA